MIMPKHHHVKHAMDRQQTSRMFGDVEGQVDIVIDENYAVDPASYNLSAFISAYNISTSQAAELSFLNGTNPLCVCCTPRPPFPSSQLVGGATLCTHIK